jgi:hypothetical protein
LTGEEPHVANIATITFVDRDSGDDGVTIVRSGPGWVAIAISLLSDGDVEAFLELEKAEALAEALNVAIRHARTVDRATE